MKKAIFIISLLFIVINTNAFGQTLETRIETLEMKVLSLERRIMELEKALKLATSSPEKSPIKMGDWQNKANWRRLKQGMTMNEVRSLLGEPETVTQTPIWTWWIYGHGEVNFLSTDEIVVG
jgi:outer membrane protein assembly factor BamE (lipoprotein component of BamABCDE complex)